MHPPTCLKTNDEHTPGIIERISIGIIHIFILSICLLTMMLIAGYNISYSISLSIVLSMIFYVYIILILYIASCKLQFDWYNQIYGISILNLGIISIISCGIYRLIKNNKDVAMATGIIVPFYIVFLLEIILVRIFKNYWISKYYKIGFTNTLQEPELRRYIDEEIIFINYH
jgi:hypothetical protein